MSSLEQVRALYAALSEKQGQDIRVIDISEVSTLADYFLITNGKNIPHIDSLVKTAEETMQKLGADCSGSEGVHGGHWALLDYGDVVVHIFSRESREWYDLERIWRAGRTLTEDELR